MPSADLQNLLEAKWLSDQRQYAAKHQILLKMLQAKPADWKQDSVVNRYAGLTHNPTGFQVHAPRTMIPVNVKSVGEKAASDFVTCPTHNFEYGKRGVCPYCRDTRPMCSVCGDGIELGESVRGNDGHETHKKCAGKPAAALEKLRGEHGEKQAAYKPTNYKEPSMSATTSKQAAAVAAVAVWKSRFDLHSSAVKAAIKHAAEDSPTVNELVNELFAARQTIHSMHLASKDYAEHVALNEFYDAMVGLIDQFVEVYQGQYELVTAPTSMKVEADAEPKTFLAGLCRHIRKTRKKLGDEDTHLQNILDEMLSIAYRAIYKLTYLGKTSKEVKAAAAATKQALDLGSIASTGALGAGIGGLGGAAHGGLNSLVGTGTPEEEYEKKRQGRWSHALNAAGRAALMGGLVGGGVGAGGNAALQAVEASRLASSPAAAANQQRMDREKATGLADSLRSKMDLAKQQAASRDPASVGSV